MWNSLSLSLSLAFTYIDAVWNKEERKIKTKTKTQRIYNKWERQRYGINQWFLFQSHLRFCEVHTARPTSSKLFCSNNVQIKLPSVLCVCWLKWLSNYCPSILLQRFIFASSLPHWQVYLNIWIQFNFIQFKLAICEATKNVNSHNTCVICITFFSLWLNIELDDLIKLTIKRIVFFKVFQRKNTNKNLT